MSAHSRQPDPQRISRGPRRRASTHLRGRRRRPALLVALVAVLGALLAATCRQRPATEPLPVPLQGVLEADVPASAAIAGGESHVYALELEAGEVVEIRVEQFGVDLVLGMAGPAAGSVSLELDGVTGQGGVETLLWVADRSGSHRFEVRPLRREARRGRYALVASASRAACAADRQAFEATGLFAEGQRLHAAPETRAKAVGKYEEAIARWRSLGNAREEARALTQLGVTLGELERLSEAMERLRAARVLWRATADPWGEAAALNFIGFAQQLRGSRAEALETYREALELRRKIEDRQGEAQTLQNMAVVEKELGDLHGAIATYERVLELQEEIGDERVRVNAMMSLGSALRDAGDLGESKTRLVKAVDLARRIGDDEAEANARYTLGLTHLQSGDFEQALMEYRSALAIHRDRRDRRHESEVVMALGYLYLSLGRNDLGLASLSEALHLTNELEDPEGQAETSVAMGVAELQRGRSHEAKTHLERALELGEDLGMPSLEAWARTVLAEVHLSESELAAARGELERALAIRRRLDEPVFQATLLERIATVDGRAGRWEEARDGLLEALELSDSVGHPNQRAVLLQSLAGIERRRGDLDAALDAIHEAVRTVEELRGGLVNLDLRASFFARKEPIHESYVDLLMELHAREPDAGHDVAAFEASERGRSRSFLDSLLAGAAGGGSAADARQRANQIRHEMFALRARLVALADTDRSSPERSRFEERIEVLEEEFRRIEVDLSATSTMTARPLTLGEIQRDVLDGETALLQFALGRERSFLWHVGVEGLSSFVLPPRSEIEDAVAELHRLVTAPYSSPEGESSDERRERLERAERRRTGVARLLSDVLLAPAAHLLDERRLAVVADGSLHQLPFGLLPDPTAPEHPLLGSREVVPIPSASVLERLRRRPASARVEQVAVVADPVFDGDDARVGGVLSRALAWFDRSATTLAPPQEIVLRSARGLGFDPFRRLRYTRDEEEVIRRFVARRRLLSALDFDASRETVFSDRFAGADVIHIATHAILHPDTAGLSGVVLSLVDERGRPRDGYLRLHDIYDLDLQAELVVLSACRTGLGKSVAGEGPLGLPRAFLSAGARRVVASLWSVDDLATSELMTRFYTELLGNGRSAGSALAAAQRSLWQEGRPPAEWAGFVLLGDWR